MKTSQSEECINICNRLLRGEISAIETYTQAIDQFKDEPEVSLLEDLRRDHIASANRLRENVHSMGGEPSNDSGIWGTWAKAVEGTARLAGNTAALKALQEGEEHGESEYEAALENDDVWASCKDMIRTELRPRQVRHIAMVRRLVDAQ